MIYNSGISEVGCVKFVQKDVDEKHQHVSKNINYRHIPYNTLYIYIYKPKQNKTNNEFSTFFKI